jgi:enolase-phosphatase E1
VNSHQALPAIRGVLLDIEGTTTPIAFVHEVLFPFARARLAKYLEAHWDKDEVTEVRRRLTEEYEQESRSKARTGLRTEGEAGLRTAGDSAAFALRLMDRDRKSPGLKQLQGLIWEEGYRVGQLRGAVYEDVPGSIRRWRASGAEVAIYSSGSELAQRLLFQSTPHGDLTPHLKAFFDTAVGAKIEAASYARIATTLGRPPGEILFVSDVMLELKAAREAGMAVVLSMRPGNPPQTFADTVESVTSLDQIDV